MLLDSHQRSINYIRLAVTDRCNLRCTYCMPEKMQFLDRSALLSYEEIVRMLSVLAAAGVHKVRITGGEPFVRKDLMALLRSITQIPGINQVSITTNGVLTEPFIPELKKLGIRQVNLSLDSLQAERFFEITRRDAFNAVQQTLESLLRHDMDVKINTVVMDGVNTDELLDFAALTSNKKVGVRFIEEMPFNGQGKGFSGINWHYKKIIGTISQAYPLEKLQDAPHSTSLNYKIKGHSGNIGVIPAFSRTFCGSCNRMRVTPTGGLKTCLYGQDVLNIKQLFREGAGDAMLLASIQNALQHKPVDGFAAQQHNRLPQLESMSAIGG